MSSPANFVTPASSEGFRGAYYGYDGSNVERDSDYRAEEYDEGDGGLGYAHLPNIDNAPERLLGGDRHPPARRRGLPRGASTMSTTDQMWRGTAITARMNTTRAIGD